MKIGIIDLGTNTFNLLIAEVVGERSFKKILSKKIAIKLLKDSDKDLKVQPPQLEKAVSVIKHYNNLLTDHKVDIVRLIGTEAFRACSNSTELIKRIEEVVQKKIEVISGDQEALYIYKGVSLTNSLNANYSLIMDIGGGSVEFIIANKTNVQWYKSFKIGISKIYELFKPSDPLLTSDINKISTYFGEQLYELKNKLYVYKPTTLIGTSGSFECIANIMFNKFFNKDMDYELLHKFYVNDLKKILKLLIILPYHDRKLIKGMDLTRVELIHISALLIDYVVNMFDCYYFIHSCYSIKEGVLLETIEKENINI